MHFWDSIQPQVNTAGVLESIYGRRMLCEGFSVGHNEGPCYPVQQSSSLIFLDNSGALGLQPFDTQTEQSKPVMHFSLTHYSNVITYDSI